MDKKQKEQIEIIDKIIQDRLISDWLEFDVGGCCILKKITKKYYVLESCDDDSLFYIERKSLYREGLDATILERSIERQKKQHFRLEAKLNIPFRFCDSNDSFIKGENLKEKVMKIIILFAGKEFYMSDIAEILHVNPKDVIRVCQELKDEHKIKEKSC